MIVIYKNIEYLINYVFNGSRHSSYMLSFQIKMIFG